ncbi:MAG: Glu-tRNA(Gln) amidotransferase subunit GatD [Thermoplasmata archaeon]
MGQEVEIRDADGRTWQGTVVPRSEFSGERILPLKLSSGYNIGLRIDLGTSYRRLDAPRGREVPAPGSATRERADPRAPVSLLTAGGTIASRVDYETGGVRPVSTEAEILAFFPDLQADGPVRVVAVLDRLSENIVPTDWVTLAEAVRSAFETGAAGVVITHGTDTMGFSAAALSFLLPQLPGPVVLVGAQRSPDRPSSDGRSNLRAAVRVARSAGGGEVVVVMHSGPSDDRFAIHRGTRVRKMHSTRRDAFRSPSTGPIGVVDGTEVRWSEPVRPAFPGAVRVDLPLDPAGGLLWPYPGLEPARAQAFVAGLRGVVIAGTGLGHLGVQHLDWIHAALARGTFVGMTTQCLAGTVDPYVYATGRELERAGVVYLGDMLPETAYAKLLWALGHERELLGVRRRMLAVCAGEATDRRAAEAQE